MKVDRVLVPLDGSPLAEMALPKALELLSDRPGSTLILLRAVDPEAPIAVHEAESYLAGVAAGLSERGITRVVRSVWYSSAVKAIVGAARVRRVDAIVMSTHGRSGLGRVMRGSVAESVLRLTRTPILLVSAGGQPEASPGNGGVARKASGDGAFQMKVDRAVAMRKTAVLFGGIVLPSPSPFDEWARGRMP